MDDPTTAFKKGIDRLRHANTLAAIKVEELKAVTEAEINRLNLGLVNMTMAFNVAVFVLRNLDVDNQATLVEVLGNLAEDGKLTPDDWSLLIEKHAEFHDA